MTRVQLQSGLTAWTHRNCLLCAREPDGLDATLLIDSDLEALSKMLLTRHLLTGRTP